MRVRTSLTMIAALLTGFTLSACGAAGTSGSAPSDASLTLSGIVSSDAKIDTVALQDSSSPAQVRSTTPDAAGAYSLAVTNLMAPFVLRAENSEGEGALYTIASGPGNADINELTTAAVAGATSDGDADEAWSNSGEHEAAGHLSAALHSLRDVLKPLFDLYQVGRICGDDAGAPDGMRALLQDVRFTIHEGTVTVTNRQTGAVIFSAPLNDLASGVFHPENMPAGPGGPQSMCAYTYSAWLDCQLNGTQARTVSSSMPAGCTGTPVLSQSCTYLPPVVTCTGFTYTLWTPPTCDASGVQTRTVAMSTPAGCTGGSPLLSQSCTPPPSTCTSFTYNPWSPSVCPASGQQTRTVASSTPAGCTGGSPLLSQSCTPPPSTCTSFTYSAWAPTTCDASGLQTRTVASSTPSGCTGGSPVLSQSCTPPPSTCTSFTYNPWSPSVCPASGQQTRTVASSTPSGCTGGSPVLSQACTPPPSTCTSFTYNPWSPSVCPASGQQTRTVASSTPSGCTGGSPVLSQSCTPPPSTCTSFTYNPWSPSVCPASGQQTRTVASSSPSGCTGGSPVLSQSCTPPPSTCTSFTYSAWAPATCDASGLQTRTVVSSAPAGCTGGSPVLSQSCTPPIDGAALYTQTCSSCHGALASSNLKGKGISVPLIQSYGMTKGLNDAQLQAIVTAVGP